MVDPLQASLKVAAVGGIFMVWSNFTIEALKFAWHIISTSPGKETWKASFKAVCGNCPELYDDDEYHLIHVLICVKLADKNQIKKK